MYWCWGEWPFHDGLGHGRITLLLLVFGPGREGMEMIRRVVFALLWGLVFCISATILGGVIWGLWTFWSITAGHTPSAGASDPLIPWVPIVLSELAGIVGFLLGIFGWLPGTRNPRRPQNAQADMEIAPQGERPLRKPWVRALAVAGWTIGALFAAWAGVGFLSGIVFFHTAMFHINLEAVDARIIRLAVQILPWGLAALILVLGLRGRLTGTGRWASAPVTKEFGVKPPPPPISPVPSTSSGAGLAIASLVLGIVSVIFSLLVVGGLFGLAGLILGLAHVRRRIGRNRMAWWGFGLSLTGIVLSIMVGVVGYLGLRQFEASMGGGSALEAWQGVPAPDFSVTTLDGEKIALRDLKGKRVILDFWATWCPPCVREIPHFIRLFNETSRDDLIIVGISSEKGEALKPFIEQRGVKYPIASAKNLPRPYSEVRSIPTTFFIDRHGIIQHVAVGYHDFTTLKARATAKDFEGEPKSPPPRTRAATGLGSTRKSAAVIRAGAPITVAPDACTWREFNRAHADWIGRRVVQPFAAAVKGQAWAGEAVPFVRETMASILLEWKETYDESGLLARGKALRAAGCEDPLVRFLTARLAYRIDAKWPEVIGDYEKALSEFDACKTPRPAARVAGILATALYERAHGKNKIAALDKKIIEWTRQAIEAGDYAGEDGKFLVRDMLASPWQEHLERNLDGVAALIEKADLPEWVRGTVLGTVEVERAWKARGTGWANSVTEEGWKGFKEHLGKAAGLLRRAWELRPDRPEAASKMITVTMGGAGAPGETERVWFDRAVAAQFDFLPAYGSFAWAMRPRWGGSFEEMMAFGEACLATKRYDTQVPVYYLDVLTDLAQEMKDWHPVYGDPDIARNVLALHHTLLEHPTRRHELRARLSHIALDGWLCGNFAEARRALDRLDWKLDPLLRRKLEIFKLDPGAMLGEIALSADPGKPDFELGEKAASEKRYPEALNRYQAALEKCGNEHASRAIHGRLECANLEQQLESGGWVDITPKGSLDAWWVREGKWEAAAERGLINHGDDGNGLIVSKIRPGANFEIRGHFRVEAKDDCCQGLGIALGFGHPEGEPLEQKWFTCISGRTNRGEPWATVMNRFRWDKKKHPLTHLKLRSDNDFLVRVRDGRVTYNCNGQPVVADFEPENVNLAEKDRRIGFGAERFCQRNTTTITRIELRRLP